MATPDLETVIDADGHIMEDIGGIWSHMPDAYRGDTSPIARSPFPAPDHLHGSNRHFTPPGAFAQVGPAGWGEFLEDVGVDRTVLYTSMGLTFGKIVSQDWATAAARAYNDWVYEEYVSKSPRFQAAGLIPIHEPDEAVSELRRIVTDLGFCGAMLPSTGAIGLQNHLGDERYWPIYEEAERLGCALGIHGGAHDRMGMDDMSPYAPVNALGHPMGQMANFAGMIFNGIFDKWPGLRIGFLEAGSAWLLGCMERFNGSWASHIQYDPNGRFLQLKKNENVQDYILRHIDDGRIFVGVEGDEMTLPFAVRITGNKPYVFSSDFPHEVNHETCKEELAELRENPGLTSTDKEAILSKNAERFYGLKPL